MSFVQRSSNMAASRMVAMMRPRLASAAPMRFIQTQNTSIKQFSRLNFQPTRRMLAQVKEEQRAHTITQRLRQVTKVPVELWPLAIVLAVAVVAAGYSLIRKLLSDPTLRLSRQNRKD